MTMTKKTPCSGSEVKEVKDKLLWVLGSLNEDFFAAKSSGSRGNKKESMLYIHPIIRSSDLELKIIRQS